MKTFFAATYLMLVPWIPVTKAETGSCTCTAGTGNISVPSTKIPNLVQNGTGTYTPASSADIALNRKVRDQLIASIPSFRNQNVRVNSRGGNVLLEGTVRSELEVDEIVNRAKNISGVSSVQSRLTVQR